MEIIEQTYEEKIIFLKKKLSVTIPVRTKIETLVEKKKKDNYDSELSSGNLFNETHMMM